LTEYENWKVSLDLLVWNSLRLTGIYAKGTEATQYGHTQKKKKNVLIFPKPTIVEKTEMISSFHDWFMAIMLGVIDFQ